MNICNCKICKDIRESENSEIDWNEIKQEFFNELSDFPVNSGRNIPL